MRGQIKIIRDELLLLILLDHPTNISASTKIIRDELVSLILLDHPTNISASTVK